MRLLLAAGAAGDMALAVVPTRASNLSLVDVPNPGGGVRKRVAIPASIAAATLRPAPCV